MGAIPSKVHMGDSIRRNRKNTVIDYTTRTQSEIDRNTSGNDATRAIASLDGPGTRNYLALHCAYLPSLIAISSKKTRFIAPMTCLTLEFRQTEPSAHR